MDYGYEKPRGPVAHYAPPSDYYLSVGIYEHEPGFTRIARTIRSLGDATHIHNSLWHIKTANSIEEIFRQVNQSLIDTSIDGHTGVMILDILRRDARWHLPIAVSEVMSRSWHARSNLFISFSLKHGKTRSSILALADSLGEVACIDGSCWYVSSQYSVREVFQLLASVLGKKDELFFFDDAGNAAMCLYGQQVLPAFLEGKEADRSLPRLSGPQLSLFQ